jgi:hypothetical protein
MPGSKSFAHDSAARRADAGALAQPLNLSVHSLPNPALAPDRRTRVGRVKMLIVLLVCAAPVIASYLTYYVIRPQGRSNYGQLIDPQRALPSASALPLTDLDGRPVDPATLKGQWLLVTVAGGQCDSACERHLYLQRQLREALGKERDRVDRVWFVDDAQPVRAELMPALQGATVLRASQASLAHWFSPETGHALEGHLYLVDPMGNWMMRFPENADGSRVKRDIERLLRASASWDTPGR